MKRGIALVLSVVMLVAAMLPLPVSAKEDKGLEEAIKVVKTKLPIPDKLSEFNYNITNDADQRIWYLNWRDKDRTEGNISVRVNEKGRILNYDNYKPYDYGSPKKLPKISRNEAKLIAEGFVSKIDPELMGKVSLRENSFNSLMDMEYSFNYVRIENGVPFYANNVSVRVSRETGEVRSYYCNWNDEIAFPVTEKVITMEEAQKAYKEKLGLELVYNYSYEDQGIRLYAAYMPKYNANYFIDAMTGDKINLEPQYPVNTYAAADKAKLEAAAGGRGEVINLTPEELKAVEKVSKLKTKAEVEKLARDFKTLELTEEFVLSYANLSRDWPGKDEFVWNLSFVKEQKDKKEYSRSVNVRINALTGEINSFYLGIPYRQEGQAKYDEKAAREAAEAFLKEIKPEKFAQSFYDEKFNSFNIAKSSINPSEYSIRYTRRVNGAPFSNNFLMVRYDAVSGKISGFEMNWFNMEFPSLDQVTPIEKIYETMFKEIGLELQYTVQYANEAQDLLPRKGSSKPEGVRLVYAVKSGKLLMFDANSGVLLDYNGQPYKEVNAVEYSDIAGHFAESQIKILAEYGIAPEGKEFKPNDSILQKDFLMMLSKTLNNYGGMPYPAKSMDKDVDELYKRFLREGIIKEREKAPDLAVTREEAVKFIIRAMKYDKVAEIPGIFNCTFKDVQEITPEMVGYVTIAQGLGIISGADGYFNPKDEMTRAQAAVVIYNYLQK